MMRLTSTTSQRCRSQVISLLLVGLFFSSITAGNAKIKPRQFGPETDPTAVGSASTVLRNYALTSIPGQRTAADLSKQNRVNHLVAYDGPAAAEVGPLPAIAREFLAVTDHSVLYLSFRLSRPGGRAPPASA
jgi:hypothetical protein